MWVRILAKLILGLRARSSSTYHVGFSSLCHTLLYSQILESIIHAVGMRFKQNIIKEVRKYPNICQNICLLFHGSSSIHPDSIINDPSGFNMQCAHGGLWGQGIYFATNSSYAHRYAFKDTNGRQCMFAASVFVGNSKELPQNRTITGPPPNYHSVQGKRDGELIHTIYRNSMAYPAYLITYRAND